jgi:hypothetical protein
MCRRFLRLRARLLLLKQNNLVLLEQQLDQIDKNEDRPLFLGSQRRDTNTERASVLSEIDAQLAAYGMYCEYGVVSRLA